MGKVATSPLPSWESPTPNTGTNILNGYVAHMWPKWLHHRCRLGGPHRLARGQKSEMATWHTSRQSGYILLAVLQVPIAHPGDKKLKCLPSQHVGKVATSPLPSWGSQTLSAVTKIRKGRVAHRWSKWLHHPRRVRGPPRSARGQKSSMPMWPTCGQSGYVTPAILVVPNVQCEDKNDKWPDGAHVGKAAISPLPSWRSPTLSAATKIRYGYVAHMWEKWLHCPCRDGGPRQPARGQKC